MMTSILKNPVTLFTTAIVLSSISATAHADTVQFYSAFETSLGHCEDTTLRHGKLSDSPQSHRGNFSAASDELDMTFSEADDANGLIRFPTIIGDAAGQVPEGAIIQKAELVMYALSPLSSGPITVHQVMEDWDEDTATWNSRGEGFGPWSAGGALYPSSGSVPVATMSPEDFPQCGYWDCPEGTMDNGWTRTDITEVMQTWVDDPSSNHGLMFDADHSGRSTFVSCEGELHSWFYSKYPMLANQDLLRPGLVVTFDMPEEELAEPKLLWENTGDRTGDQEPLAILEAYPFAFVTGVEHLEDDQTKWLFRKYWNRNGNITFEETEEILGTPNAIVKGSTHIFVGGCRVNDAGDCDSYVRAYSYDGVDWETPLQVAPFDLAGGHDTVNAIAYYNKTLFVAATATSEDGDTDYMVIKLDPQTGEVIDYDHIETPYVDDAALDIKVGGSRVFAVGSSDQDGQTDGFVKAYGTKRLNTLWERHFDLAGDDDVFSSVLVGRSKVIVAGTGTSQYGDTDVIAMGYRLSDGAPEWTMPIVRDYKGGDDELVAATWYKYTQSRFMLAANVDQPLGIPGFVVSGHYGYGADAWKDETVIAGSVATPYAVAGGKYRTYVAAEGLDQGESQHLARSYASSTGSAYWQERLDVADTFYASLVATDLTTEQRVYVAGCRVNDDGGCSISVRLLKGTK